MPMSNAQNPINILKEHLTKICLLNSETIQIHRIQNFTISTIAIQVIEKYVSVYMQKVTSAYLTSEEKSIRGNKQLTAIDIVHKKVQPSTSICKKSLIVQPI